MDPELEGQIKERFAQLPADVQQAIQGSAMEEALRKIGEAHQLHIDQMGALGDEVRLVMLGFADPAEFAGALTAQARIPAAEAEQIATKVGEQIFAPIRESMQRFMEERELDDAAETIAAQPAPAVPASGRSPQGDGPSEPGRQVSVERVSVQNPTPTSPAMPIAEKILTQPTVTVAPATPLPATNPNPRPYKTDPYREPAE